MKDQLFAIYGMIINPKVTLKSLPEDRIYALAFLSPIYFGFVRAIQKGGLNKLAGTGTFDRYLIACMVILFVSFFAIMLWAIFIKAIVKIFKKNLTAIKLMNLYGYALVPRLLISILGNIVILVAPSSALENLIGGQELPLVITISVIGIAVFIYSIFLYVFGIIVSPGYVKK